MQVLLWLQSHFEGATLQSGIERANRLYWSIEVVEGEAGWVVYGGEKAIYKTDNREALDAFLYGFGLAYVVFPPEVFEPLYESVRKLVGE